MIAALAIAYLFVGAELAAYTYGFDEGTDRPEDNARWFDLLFIVLAWPVVLVSNVWRETLGGDDE